MQSFSTSGALQWERLWALDMAELPDQSFEIAGMDVDASGNVHVIGYWNGSFGSATGNNTFACCFNSAGEVERFNIYHLADEYYLANYQLNEHGELFVSARAASGLGDGNVVFKINSDGSFDWGVTVPHIIWWMNNSLQLVALENGTLCIGSTMEFENLHYPDSGNERNAVHFIDCDGLLKGAYYQETIQVPSLHYYDYDYGYTMLWQLLHSESNNALVALSNEYSYYLEHVHWGSFVSPIEEYSGVSVHELPEMHEVFEPTIIEPATIMITDRSDGMVRSDGSQIEAQQVFQMTMTLPSE